MNMTWMWQPVINYVVAPLQLAPQLCRSPQYDPHPPLPVSCLETVAAFKVTNTIHEFLLADSFITCNVDYGIISKYPTQKHQDNVT